MIIISLCFMTAPRRRALDSPIRESRKARGHP
jgi:hypothetical protein